MWHLHGWRGELPNEIEGRRLVGKVVMAHFVGIRMLLHVVVRLILLRLLLDLVVLLLDLLLLI